MTALEMTKDSRKLNGGSRKCQTTCHFNFESLPSAHVILISCCQEFLFFFSFFFPLFLGSYYNYNILKNVGVIIIEK